MRNLQAALSLCLVVNAGCVSRPESIEARYVSPNMYQAWTCDQLADEKTRLESEVYRISGLQRENANADTAMVVGSLFLWPILIGMTATKDRKDELGRIKGEYSAVESLQRTRPCPIPPPPMPAAATPPPPP